MNTKETYEYLKEHYHTADPVVIEQVTSLYQVVNDLDNGYRRLLDTLMVTYQMGYSQAQIDNISGMTAINEELETLLKGE